MSLIYGTGQTLGKERKELLLFAFGKNKVLYDDDVHKFVKMTLCRRVFDPFQTNIFFQKTAYNKVRMGHYINSGLAGSNFPKNSK